MKKIHLSLKNEITSIKEFDEQEYQEIEKINKSLNLKFKDEVGIVDRFYQLTKVEKTKINEYCFLVKEDNLIKIAQIPNHYLKKSCLNNAQNN
ncbi:MAG: hypothetical protein ACN6OJ_14400 [Chryseobacterium sp.]|uniref:hypothetical protein n=1 Tax=Chryseobacterium sp. TaxID=1871047 RepID=UPI003D1196B2